MLFVVAGLFRPDVEPERLAVHEQFGEHLTQRSARVHFGGPLYDADGTRSGVLLIVEAADFPAAERFLEQSPYKTAGLYGWTLVSEVRPEVGGYR
jgi:uncharacterized protein YciI